MRFSIRQWKRGSLALAGAVVFAAGANAQTGVVGDALRDAGNAVDRAGRATGRAVDRAERQTERAIRRTERDVNDRYNDTRGPVRDAIGDTVRGAGRIAGEATRAVTGRPRLGVTFDEARDNDLYISDVEANSVAYRAGIRSGDQIVSINGRRFDNYRDAVPYIRDFDEDRMEIVVLRDGREMNLSADLAARIDRRDDVRVESRTTFRGDRPTLGVWFDPNASDLTIVRVGEGSPAYRAGIRRGDRIVSLDGQRVRTHREVTRYLADIQPDEELDIVVLRDGRELKLDARLTAQADVRVNERRVESRGYDSDRASLGVVFDDSDRDSLVITRIESNSPAYRAGIRRGDRIYAVNGRRVNAFRDLTTVLADLEADANVSVGVVREDRRMTFDTRLASRSDVFNDRNERSGRSGDRARERADDRSDRVADRYDERRERADDRSEDRRDRFDDRMDERADRVTDRADDRRDRINDRAEDARDDIRRRADRTDDRFDETREARRERAERTRDRVEDRTENARDRASEARDRANDARTRARENVRENFREGFQEGRNEDSRDTNSREDRDESRDDDSNRQPPAEPREDDASDRNRDSSNDSSTDNDSNDSNKENSSNNNSNDKNSNDESNSSDE